MTIGAPGGEYGFMLNISKDGTINEAGHPFLFGAFIPREKYNSLPREVIARKMPQAFTVELPSGAIEAGQVGDYVLLDPTNFSVVGWMTAADFAGVWDLASMSVV